jgi:class 3 adenylate cyclase/tetratricopeptide (TPR) repeat protein
VEPGGRGPAIVDAMAGGGPPIRHVQGLGRGISRRPPGGRTPADVSDATNENAAPDIWTFLLTDVVGSTRMWEADPEAASVSMQRHEELIEAAVARNNGRLLKSRGEGDSTFSVFARAPDALLAAAQAQADLTAEDWPRATPVAVRVALHSGAANEWGDDYFGPTVNRAARLRSLAGPGQVLLSRAVADLVTDQIPAHLHLVVVGRRKLRDLARPEQVFALAGPGLHTVVSDDASGRDDVPLPNRLARAEPYAFFGRTEERAVIDQALAGVEADGWRQVVVVGGDPGIGKTRLIDEAARSAHGRGAMVLLGRCSEGVTVPFGPFLEALGHLARHVSPEVLRTHANRHGGRLARLVPDLAERLPGEWDGPVADIEAERHLMFVAAADLLADTSRGRTVVLVLDDLQWSDSVSIQCLRYLIQVGDPGALLVLATCRDREIEADGPVAHLMSDLWGEEGTSRVALGGLETPEVRELVEALAGEPLGDRGETLVAALIAETGGNPFIVRQLLLHMWDTGAISRDSERWTINCDPADLVLPDSVQNLITSRVRRLDEMGGRALSAAAVIGNDFDLPLVAAVLESDKDQILDALEAARLSGLLRRGLQPGDFSFTHAIVCHALRDRLGPARTQRLHARTATVLAERPNSSPSTVAHHFVAADRECDLASTALWTGRAGRAAMGALAPVEAVYWFNTALTLFRSDPDADPDAITELMIDLGQAQRFAGDPQHRRTFLEAANRARSTGRDDLLIRAALSDYRGYESNTGAVSRRRVSILEAALEVAPRDSGDRARLLANLAAELAFDRDQARTLGYADEALQLARAGDDRSVLLHVMLARFPVVFGPDQAHHCLDETAELIALAQELDNLGATVLAAAFRFSVCLALADLRGVDEALDLARTGIERLPLPPLQYLVVLRENIRALLDGDLEASERFATQAFEIGRSCGVPEAATHYFGQVTRIRTAQNRLAEILPGFEPLARHPNGHPALRTSLAMVYCRLGRLDDARPLFDADAAKDFATLPWDRYLLHNMAAYAEVCATLEEAKPAALLYERLVPYCDQFAVGDATFLAPVAYYCARLAAVVGNLDRALVHFAEADRINRALGVHTWTVTNGSEWAAALLRRGGPGDREEARRLLDRVLPEASAMMYSPVVTRCQGLIEEYFGPI